MPTIISHPAIAVALWPSFRRQFDRAIFFTGAICSVLPDIDVIGFRFGIAYGDAFGHRGFTHSIAFALLVSLLVTALLRVHKPKVRVFAFLFLCTVSHGLLDALTDGGLGVAFFSPFITKRYFFPWRPLRVSPIGIYAFFSGHFLTVLQSEIEFVWIPCVLVWMISTLVWAHQTQ